MMNVSNPTLRTKWCATSMGITKNVTKIKYYTGSKGVYTYSLKICLKLAYDVIKNLRNEDTEISSKKASSGVAK